MLLFICRKEIIDYFQETLHSILKNLKTQSVEEYQNQERFQLKLIISSKKSLIQAHLLLFYTWTYTWVYVFLDQRTNALIAGDSFQVRGGVAVSGQLKPLFPFPAFGTWSKELALKSAEKLYELNPSLLAVGHGRMLSQPLKMMEKQYNKQK